MRVVTKTFSANGSSDIGTFRGSVHVHCSGTFGGGTVTISYEGGDGSFHDVASAAYLVATDSVINLPPDVLTRMKATLTGATGPTLFCELRSA